MKRFQGSSCRRLLRRETGGVMLEFAIILPILVLVVFGIIDFGHAWYMKTEITSASRSGARYASQYNTDPSSGLQVLPCNLNPSVSTWVTNNYASLLPSNANLHANVTGAGYTSGIAGQDIIVTVTARKYWFVLGAIVPGLTSYLDMTATTAMKCE